MTCTATIQVGGQTLTCEHRLGGHYPDAHHTVALRTGGFITWTDEAPSAVPHRDPEPSVTYSASPEHKVSPVTGVKYVAFWKVLADDGYHVREVARFTNRQQKLPHPDPQGAAEAEAARLNGTYHDECDAQFEQESHAETLRERDAARASFDSYHKALNRIAREGASGQLQPALYAREVLDGGTP